MAVIAFMFVVCPRIIQVCAQQDGCFQNSPYLFKLRNIATGYNVTCTHDKSRDTDRFDKLLVAITTHYYILLSVSIHALNAIIYKLV